MQTPGMTKLIFNDSWGSLLDISMRVVEDPKQLQKSASTIFGCEYTDVQPDKDHVGIHVVALGDYETYGLNRNFDGFKRASCQGFHSTFVKHGHVYQHHCFPLNTRVLVEGGRYVPIQDIKVGTKVLTHTGRYQPVTRTFESRSPTSLLRFHCKGVYLPLICTDNHPLSVVRFDHSICKRFGAFSLQQCLPHTAGTYKRCDDCKYPVTDLPYEWMPAASVRHGDFLCMPRRFELQPSELTYTDARFLGLFFAEGSFDRSQAQRYTLALTFSVDERDTLVQECIVYCRARGWRFRGPYTHKRNHTLTLQINDKVARTYLEKHFCGVSYSHERIVPASILHGTDTIKKAFLGGWLDGDGCYQPAKRLLRGRSTSYEALLCFAHLAHSIGMPVKLYSDGQAKPIAHNGYLKRASGVITAYGSYCQTLKEHCTKLTNADLTPVGKEQRSFAVTPDYMLFPIDSIDRIGALSESVYNLEVATDSSFIAEGFVVHNCNSDPAKSMGRIVKSAYNEPMGRIELFIHAHKEKAHDHLEKLATDGEVSVSMACRVLEDSCTICGTMRKNASDPHMCDHVRNEFGKTYDDGRVVGTYNPEPKFFDISFVRRPADRIAWNLKTAGAPCISAVKMAEDAGVWTPDDLAIVSPEAQHKRELMRKLAVFEDMYAVLPSKSTLSTAERYYNEMLKAASTDIPQSLIEQLRRFEPVDVMTSLAKRGEIMDVRSFYKYALGDEYNMIAGRIPAVASIVRNRYSTLLKSARCQGVCNDRLFDAADPYASRFDIGNDKLNAATTKLAADYSVLPAYADQRIIDRTLEHKVISIDSASEIVSNDVQVNELLADKYAAYKLAAVAAVLSYNTDVDEGAILAQAVAQNHIKISNT